MTSLQFDSPPAAHSSRRLREPAFVDSPANGKQVPWTAARCLRLLRPLSSKISLLGKLKKDGIYAEREAESRQSLTHEISSEPTGPSGVAPWPLIKDPGSGQNCDSAWDDGPRTRKRLRCTYSSRGKGGTLPASYSSAGTEKKDQHDGAHLKMKRARSSVSDFGEAILALNVEGCKDKFAFLDSITTGTQKASAEIQRVHTSKREGTWGPYRSTTGAISNDKDRWKLCKGIADSLSALLRATESTVKLNEHGAQSLFSVCLRKIPRYIVEQENFVMQNYPDCDHDIVSEMYAELEDTAISDSWRPLRVIVRSHGVRLVCNAIKQNILSIGMATKLVSLCLSLQAHDEASLLLDSVILVFLEVVNSSPGSVVARKQTHILEGVQEFVQSTGRYSDVYRKLTNILDSARSPKSCETLIETFAGGAVRSIALNEYAEEASHFLRAVVRVSCFGAYGSIYSQIVDLRRLKKTGSKRPILRSHQPHGKRAQSAETALDISIGRSICDRQEPAVRSSMDVPRLLATISALQCLQFRLNDVATLRDRRIIEDLPGQMAIEARQWLEIAVLQANRRRVATESQSLATILLANELCHVLVQNDSDSRHGLSAATLNILSDLCLEEGNIVGLGGFLHQFATVRAQLSNDNAFDIMKSLVDSLCTVVRECDSTTPLLPGKIAVAAAFAFSEDTNLPKHLEWALKVEESIYGKGQISPEKALVRTPAKAITRIRGGFRWEDGICEWIRKTPAMSLGQRDELVDSAFSMTPVPKRALKPSFQLLPSPPCTVQMEPDLTGSSGESDEELLDCQISTTTNVVGDTSLPNIPSVCHVAQNTLAEAVRCADDDTADELDELCDAWYEMKPVKMPRIGVQKAQPTRSNKRSLRTGGIAGKVETTGTSLTALLDLDMGSNDVDELSF